MRTAPAIRVFVVALVSVHGAITARPALTQISPHQPRGVATDVTSAEIAATVQKTAASPTSDQAIRVVIINNEYNVNIGVVHRAAGYGAK